MIAAKPAHLNCGQLEQKLHSKALDFMLLQLSASSNNKGWRAAPAQRGLPEAGDPGRVGGVNAQALDAYFHVLIVLRRVWARPVILYSSPSGHAAGLTPGRTSKIRLG